MSAADVGVPTATVRRPHYPCLEGLRTLGVMALFLQHTGYTTGIQLRNNFSWMGRLEWGPGLFFVLSAFLLYQPFSLAALRGTEPPRWAAFMKARLLRVMPAYWLAITLLILFFRADRSNPFSSGVKVFGWRDGLEVYTLTQVYDARNFAHGISAAYTLSTELVFYLLVPFFGLWLVKVSRGRTLDARLRVQLASLGVLALIAFAWRQLIYAPVRPQGGNFCATHPSAWRCAAVRWFPGYLDYFVLGAAVAAIGMWAMLRGENPKWLDRIGRHPTLWWMGFAATFVVYSKRYPTHGLQTVAVGEYQIRYYLVGLMCLFLLLPGAFGDPNQGIVRRFLQWKPIAYAGLVSYGIYLWHQGFTDKALEWTRSNPFQAAAPRVSEVAGLAHFVWITLIALASSLVIATVSWYWFERPINRRRDVPLSQWPRRLTR